MSDESIYVCKYENKAYMNGKYTGIQKSNVFAYPMYIFSEKGSAKRCGKLLEQHFIVN